MKIYRYSQSISGSAAPFVVNGALLADGGAYSLLQAWPSLGDRDLDFYLQDLRKPTTALARRALQILEVEKAAKRKNISLLPVALPPSHLLLSRQETVEELQKHFVSGVDRFKVKIGSDAERDLAYLKGLDLFLEKNPVKLRLDVNQQWSREEAFAFFDRLGEKLLASIDFVEDPLRGTERDWDDFRQAFDLRCAQDFAPESFRPVADVWILKPSREDPWSAVEAASRDMKRIVITSALDHPLGYVVAAWEAERIQAKHPLLIDACGFLPAPAPLQSRGTLLDFAQLSGSGFGLDKFLGDLPWEDYAGPIAH